MSYSPDKPTGELGFTPDPEFGSPARGPPPPAWKDSCKGMECTSWAGSCPTEARGPFEAELRTLSLALRR